MNDIVTSKINLFAVLLNRGLSKSSSSHRPSELRLSSSGPGILKADQRDRYASGHTWVMQEKMLIVLNARIASADGTQRFKVVPKLVLA